MLLHLLPAICASVFGAVGCQQDQPTAVHSAHARADVAPARDTTLAPSGDTYIRQGSPNQNQGAELILRLQSSGENRALLRWDQQALVQAVGSGTVTAARLELTIADLGDNWSTAGRTIDLYRLTHDWTELGATWNCAVDSVPGNSRAECSGAAAWDMDHSGSYPWVATPTATALLKNGQTGVVTFDVTADVLAWLGGQPNDGWILKKMVEGDPGNVDFGSRESAPGPQLVLAVVSASSHWPLLTTEYPSLDTSRLVSLPGDSAFMFRTEIALRFTSAVTDSAKRAFFTQHSMTVLGVTENGEFFVHITDPGPLLESFYDALDRVRSYPEIRLAIPLWYTPLPQHEDLRLPTDGPGQARSDWLNRSEHTWAMRAIRAPLAWGCETGLYGAEAAPVGIFEWKHAPGHPEFARSVPVLREPSSPALNDYKPVEPDTVAAKRAHAVATTGLLAAEGDNASGIAGIGWRSHLFMYAGYDHLDRAVPLTSGFYVIAQLMVSDSIRVLSISVDAGFFSSVRVEDRRAQIGWLVDAVGAELLDKLPSLLVVVAAGNERIRRSATDYYQDSLVTPLRAALLLLRDDPKYRDRIIVVAGTEDGNRFWDTWTENSKLGSNFFSSATDIAAPALNVTVLGPWHGEAGPSVPIAIETGTSLSAPLVAGVAAQLLAMDSTLKPEKVKDYILRGAQQPRLSPTTGQPVPAQPVQGAPETIYQLDAYGALTLLSQERPAAPLCGVSADLAPSPDDGSFDGVMLRRVPGFSDTLRLSLAGLGIFPDGVSLAQGGRLLAVSGGNDQTPYRTVFVDQTGRAVAPAVEGIERRFLERDTVDLDWNVHEQRYPQVTLRLGDSAHTVRSLDLVADVVPQSSDVYQAQVVVSPSGEYAPSTWDPTSQEAATASSLGRSCD